VYKEVSIKIAPAAPSKRQKIWLRDFFLKSGDCETELIAQKRALIVSARINFLTPVQSESECF